MEKASKADMVRADIQVVVASEWDNALETYN